MTSSTLGLLSVFCALLLVQASATLDNAAILKGASDLQEWLVNLRRELHQMPEAGYHEFNTTVHIRKILEAHKIRYKFPYAKTGVVAFIGKQTHPSVALRADMDALPIMEPPGASFRSKNPGWMHACGHDAHMTMLMGAALLLKAHEDEIPGLIKVVFQPNEEGGAAADVMVREGAIDDVSAIFGMHVMPLVDSGYVATRPGTIMAGALSFHITVKGRGGHAAMPHLNIDPIVAASGIITALQTLVSRETSPLASGVLSVTLLRAGDAYNVIPDVAEFGGTIRALTHDHLMFLKKRVMELVPAVAGGYSCTADVDWRLDDQPYYPPTVNDPETVVFAKQVASNLLGPEYVQETEPLMAGEDFAFYCRTVPCAFLFLGIRNITLGSTYALHNPKFMLDEGVLYRGAALHTALALEYLRSHPTSLPSEYLDDAEQEELPLGARMAAAGLAEYEAAKAAAARAAEAAGGAEAVAEEQGSSPGGQDSKDEL